MPQVVIIDALNRPVLGFVIYTSVSSWVGSTDYSTDWGAGNKATALIRDKIGEVVTINTATPPNGALLTAFQGQEYNGMNSATCAGLFSSTFTLTLRSLGIEISHICIESTGNAIPLRLGAFEAVDAHVHDVGVKASSKTNGAHGVVTYSAAPFTGTIERVVVEESGGFGLWLRDGCVNPVDHITVLDSNTSNNAFRDGVRSDDSSNILTNVISFLSPLSVVSADAFSGQFSPSSGFNAGDDSSTPGTNPVDNRSTGDLVDYAAKDFRTALNSPLATAGSEGGFIGAFLEESAGEVTANGVLTLPALSVSGSATDGSPEVTANGVLTLPALSVSGSATDGSPEVTANGVLTLPALSVSGSATDGSPEVTANGVLTLPALSVSGSATDGSPEVTANGVLTLPALSVSGSATDGSPEVTANGVLTLPALSVSGSDEGGKADFTIIIDVEVKTIQTTDSNFILRI